MYEQHCSYIMFHLLIYVCSQSDHREEYVYVHFDAV
jgi:hypothetical protein